MAWTDTMTVFIDLLKAYLVFSAEGYFTLVSYALAVQQYRRRII